MTIRCFYHSQDLDGKCSAAIVRRQHPEVVFHPINYGEAFPWSAVAADDLVYMVDFSLSVLEMQRLQTSCARFVWIDHHRTAIAAAAAEGFEPDGLRGADGLAACQLAWTFLFPAVTPPVAVELLGAYDVGRHDEPVLDFQFGCRSLADTGPASQVWNHLLQFPGQKLSATHYRQYVHGVVMAGVAVRGYKANQDRYLVSQAAFLTLVAGRKTLAVNCLYASSSVFQSVVDRHPDVELLCAFGLEADGKWRHTLWRGPAGDGLDCGVIAQKFGGGGHPGAAGCVTSGSIFDTGLQPERL